MIVTIDGPAGSGKSTAARELAKVLGIARLDTGAMYRAVALAALRAGVCLEDERALAALAGKIDLGLNFVGDVQVVLLNGEDVSREIRSAEVSANTHFVAGSPAVRAVLVQMQRRIGRELAAARGGIVAEGRDQGTVVFPDADVKFFVDASPEVRARRRCAEMRADGQDVTYEDVLAAIVTRDGHDSTRAVAPLMRPPGAVVIDTSDRTIAQTTAELVRQVRAAQ
jgi:cytidylate kinase